MRRTLAPYSCRRFPWWVPAPLLLVLAACAQPVIEQPMSGVPVHDKFGGVSYCVGPDGEEYPAIRSQIDPCERRECPDGFISPSGEFICPQEECPGGFVSAAGELICPWQNDEDDGNGGGRGTGTPNAPRP